MTDMFGQYKSQQTRALATIDSSKYPDTNVDLEKNVQRLNQFVDYIAQYLQIMQKGVDQANQDALQQIRSIAQNAAVLLAGGTIVDVDLGDLQYFLPAIGALLGFDEDVPFPINLLYAAEHFFLGYVVPLDSFGYAVQDQINAWADTLGINQDFMDATNELMDAVNAVTANVYEFFVVLQDLIGILGLGGSGTGAFADLWHAVSVLLGTLSLSSFGTITDPVFEAAAPWVHQLASAVGALADIISAFNTTTSTSIDDLGAAVQGIKNFISMFDVVNFDVAALDFNILEAIGDWATNGLLQAAPLKNFYAMLGGGTIDFTDGGFNLSTARQTFVSNIVEPLLAAVSGIDQALRDQLTGIVDSTDTDIDNWLLSLLTGTSSLDAAKLTNITNIPAIAQSSITNLVTDLASKLDPTSSLDGTKLTGSVLASLISGTLATGNIPSLPASIITSGTFANARIASGLDAAKLTTGTLPIARIANGAITDALLASGISGSKLTGSVAAALISGALADANIPDLDAAKIPTGNFDQSRINGLSAALASALGAIPSGRLGQVPLSSIADINPNMLWNGSFDDSTSINPASDFVWDGTIGRTTLGSAKVTLNGANHSLWGNEVAAVEGDEMTCTAYTRYSSLAGTGTKLAVYMGAFRSDDTLISSTLIGGITATGTNATWQTITGTYTAPANTAYVAMELRGTSTATAGTGWFDDAVINRVADFKPAWVTDLANKIQNLQLDGTLAGQYVQGIATDMKTEIEQMFKDMVAKFFNLEDLTFVPTQSETKEAMGNIFELISSQATWLSRLQSQVEAQASSGNSLSVDFTDFPNNTVLPAADYDVTYTGTGTAIWGTRSGAAGWYNQDSNTNTARVRVLTTRPASDYAIIRATMKDLPQNGGGKVSAVARLTSDWANYVFARGFCDGFLSYKADLGCVVGGTEYIFVQNVAMSWNTTMTIYFGYEGNPRRLVVFSGNSKIIDYDESTRSGGAISLMPSAQGTPSNYRYFGMLAQRIGSKNCGSLSAFSMNEP